MKEVITVGKDIAKQVFSRRNSILNRGNRATAKVTAQAPRQHHLVANHQQQ